MIWVLSVIIIPKLKNNQSTIVNLANSYLKGSHWISMKFINNKLFYFDSYGIPFIPDIIKKQYLNSKITTNIYIYFFLFKTLFTINQKQGLGQTK